MLSHIVHYHESKISFHRVKNVIALTLIIFSAHSVMASNAIYTTGYGAVSSSLSGADIAIETDTTAVVTNPATLAFVDTSRADVYTTVAQFYANEFSDQYGNNKEVETQFTALFGGGYSKRLEKYPSVVATIGLNIQGGVGYDYDDITTVFGTTDSTSVAFSAVKISPAIAWNATPKLKLGAALSFTYASIEQEFFPETSISTTPSGQPFYGITLEDTTALTYGVRIGAHYQATDNIEMGLSYTPPLPLDLDNGNLEMNYQAEGLGKVNYRSARIEGLELPEEAGLGIAWQASPTVKIITEANWFGWGAINRLHIKAKNPNQSDPKIAEEVNLRSSLNFRDRVAYALAMEWSLANGKVLRMGFSHINQIQPSNTVSPIAAFIGESEMAIGLEIPLRNNWLLNIAAEYEIAKRITYTNPEQPYGENAGSRFGLAYIHFNLSKVK